MSAPALVLLPFKNCSSGRSLRCDPCHLCFHTMQIAPLIIPSIPASDGMATGSWDYTTQFMWLASGGQGRRRSGQETISLISHVIISTYDSCN